MSAVVESIYISSFLVGIAAHEYATCFYFIFAKGLSDPKQLRKPVFLVCIATFASLVTAFATMTAILHWKSKGSKDPFSVQNEWFVQIATTSATTIAFGVVGINILLAQRTKAMFNDYSNWHPVKSICYFLCFADIISNLASVFISPLVFKDGLLGYAKNPLYSLYALNGLFMHGLIAVNTIVSSFFFLNRIYSVKDIPMKAFLIDWMLNQDGIRLCLNLAANVFVIYSNVTIMTVGQNELTTHTFCTIPKLTAIDVLPCIYTSSLFLFMEHSYVVAREVMGRHQTQTIKISSPSMMGSKATSEVVSLSTS
jgi:hypothetical protein